jgi:hypothetical protein
MDPRTGLDAVRQNNISCVVYINPDSTFVHFVVCHGLQNSQGTGKFVPMHTMDAYLHTFIT